MTTRYVSSLSLAVGGAFLVAASQAFSSDTVGWLAFAIGIFAVAAAAGTAAFGRHALIEHGLDGLTLVLGAWTVVASLVFNGSTNIWLSFAEGAGLFGFAVAGLVVHEARLTRQAHLAPEITSEGRTTVSAAV